MDIPILTIIAAAAVDSINPCAIGVLVFMLTFLVTIKGTKKRILSIGATYIFVVYLCYFLAGIGLVKILSALPFLDIIYKIAGALVMIAGVIDLYDGLTKKGKPLLSIPASASPKIKKYIQKATVPAAVILGGLVALFELPCTGGVYIAILSMLSKSDRWSQAVLMLAIYNFVFVLPLIVILLLVTFGLSSDKVEKWRKGNRDTMRIILGVAMILLGVLMMADFF